MKLNYVLSVLLSTEYLYRSGSLAYCSVQEMDRGYEGGSSGIVTSPIRFISVNKETRGLDDSHEAIVKVLYQKEANIYRFHVEDFPFVLGKQRLASVSGMGTSHKEPSNDVTKKVEALM